MPAIQTGDLFSKLAASRKNEKFLNLVKRDGIKLERILSKGQSTPAGKWLKSKGDEWVVVLRGRAKLIFETKRSFIMEPGDHVLIPAGMRHRVEWTSSRTETVWLALHLPEKRK